MAVDPEASRPTRTLQEMRDLLREGDATLRREEKLALDEERLFAADAGVRRSLSNNLNLAIENPSGSGVDGVISLISTSSDVVGAGDLFLNPTTNVPTTVRQIQNKKLLPMSASPGDGEVPESNLNFFVDESADPISGGNDLDVDIPHANGIVQLTYFGILTPGGTIGISFNPPGGLSSFNIDVHFEFYEEAV